MFAEYIQAALERLEKTLSEQVFSPVHFKVLMGKGRNIEYRLGAK
jgi:hypothetical protein